MCIVLVRIQFATNERGRKPPHCLVKHEGEHRKVVAAMAPSGTTILGKHTEGVLRGKLTILQSGP